MKSDQHQNQIFAIPIHVARVQFANLEMVFVLAHAHLDCSVILTWAVAQSASLTPTVTGSKPARTTSAWTHVQALVAQMPSAKLSTTSQHVAVERDSQGMHLKNALNQNVSMVT